MSAAALEKLIRRMEGRRLLCVGDMIFDRFIYGGAHRISREAPVPVLSQSRREWMLGAAGNVAQNILALGGETTLVALVGDDGEGHVVSGLLTEGDFSDVELVTAKGRTTPMKTRYVAGSQQVLCVDRDPDKPLSDEVSAELGDVIESRVPDCDLVVISDYGRGAMTPDVIRRTITAARKADKRVAADPRGRDFRRYNGAFILKPNFHDLERETGLPCSSDPEVEHALRVVMETLEDVENLLVTRGAKGMALLRRGRDRAEFFRATPRDVFDVSGAGDTTVAALALALAGGGSMEDAIGLANRAAGIVVTKMGTAVATADEVVADAQGRSPAGAYIGDIAMAQQMVARWRSEDVRIGLTNGCFDILHAGHVAMLGHARRLCDRLVVGVNSDASVRRLKGDSRPVNPQTDRAWLVSALGAVDMVAVFEEDTAVALVDAVKPDVYIKGGDYASPDDIPEAPFVRQHGGEVVLTPFTPGQSTSTLIKKLKDVTDA